VPTCGGALYFLREHHREHARGFALHQAAMIIPYYTETNPRFAAMAKRTVEEVLTDINA